MKVLINHNEISEDLKISGAVLLATFPNSISPWFITGFTEAEGNFDISIFSNPKALAGTGIKFRFRIALNSKDVVLLCAIKNYFNAGVISKVRKDTGVVTLEISSIDSIKNIIIPFFDSYPLKGTKYYDYVVWRDGFKDFLNSKDSLNTKISLIERLKSLKGEYNKSRTNHKVPVEHLINIDPNYISGLVSGDGSFSVVTGPTSLHRGFGRTVLVITQHTNNLKLLQAIISYFGVGHIGKVASRPNLANLVITDKDVLVSKIIPFFNEHPVYGLHSISFLKWRYIVKLSISYRSNKALKSKVTTDLYMSQVRTIWEDSSALLYNDLSIYSKELDLKMVENSLIET